MKLLTAFILIFFSLTNGQSVLVSKTNMLNKSSKKEQAKKGFIPKLEYFLEHYDKELNVTYKKVLKKLKKSG